MQGVSAMRVAKPVVLNAEDDRRLRILSQRKRIEARVQMRARIVLLASGGLSDKDIALKFEHGPARCSALAGALAAGVDGLLQDEQVVVRITLEQTHETAHWSTRTLAAHLGTSASAVARIWRAHGFKPIGSIPSSGPTTRTSSTSSKTSWVCTSTRPSTR
jgi:hypothetical protein